MIISKRGRFVFIANTKTASTTIEDILEPYATLAFVKNPQVKHMGIQQYRTMLEPSLIGNELDNPLESFAVIRDPIDWLFSWYSYRSRDEIQGTTRSTKTMSFDAFIASYLSKPRPEFAKVGSPSGLLKLKGGKIGVNHIYAFEQIDKLVEELGERLGVKLSLDRHLNASPQKQFEVSPENYRELEKFFKKDFELYRQAQVAPRRITAA